MVKLIWLVPLLPLIGFLLIGLLNRKISKRLTAFIASGSVLGSFVVSVLIFFQFLSGNAAATTYDFFDWIHAGDLHISFSFLVDQLSSLFLLIITGVGFLIHLYSVGYMAHDDGFRRFFAYLNLFIFFMLLLVLGSNYLIMFVGWEGVGLCSYLLIGFWYKNTEYNNAAKKAFIMNRIGDLGFLLGVILIFINFGSISFSEVFNIASTSPSNQPVIIAITALLFIGATGKSAQLPLYTWLPDAMAGPTPVSALIHAATMVTAGIYMIARSNILFTLAPDTTAVIAVIGLITALVAATIGLAQNDIKKVLAYSTVSQLGYMFLALGVGAYTGAVFHVMTHAFFKALLFLGAGSVIHAMSGEQDIRKMGGLKKYLPITYFTFLIGTIAISGIPPLAGFFSKDEILAHTFAHNKLFWFVGLVTSALTAFYMFRLFFLTFHGNFRGTDHQKNHLHESPKTMTIPLIVLAILSVIGGFFGIPHLIGQYAGHLPHGLQNFLAPVFNLSSARVLPMHISEGTEWALMAIAVGAAIASIGLAYNMYVKRSVRPPVHEEQMPAYHKVAYNKYYVDELYAKTITKPLNWFSDIFYRFVDLRFIDAIVNGFGVFITGTSHVFRYAQTGNVGFYIFAMVLSIILILFFKSI